MQQMTHDDCQQTGGGSPIALLGFGLAVLMAAGGLREFTDGVLDGFGGL